MSENTAGDLRKYVVFVVEDEPAWEAKSDAERQVTYDADYAFGQALEKRGGKVVGGSGLAHTSRWQILRNDAGITRLDDETLRRVRGRAGRESSSASRFSSWIESAR